MALWNLYCVACGKHLKRVTRDLSAAMSVPCPQCKSTAFERKPIPPSTSVMERLDNGFMLKALERPAKAEEWSHEREDADTKAREEANSV